MALIDGVREIRDHMAKQVQACGSPESPNFMVSFILTSYVGMLDVLIKSHEDIAAPAKLPIDLVPPEIQHAVMIQREREKIRQERLAKGKYDGEGDGPRMISCEDGPQAGLFVPLAPEMPEGAKTMVDSCVYQLRGGKLYHVAPS